MAVLRPDQVQLTFASEGAAGADQDLVTLTSAQTNSNSVLSTAAGTPVLAGAISIGVASAAAFDVGDFLAIGGGSANQVSVPGAAATKSIVQTEIRRLEHKEGNTLFFDRPLGVTHHANDGSTGSGAGGQNNSVGKCISFSPGIATAIPPLIKFVPGVYETVDTPDPAPTIEPRYFLGTNSKRNFTSVYTGQRTYQGALTGTVLLNGWPLRFPIGVEIPKAFGSSSTFDGDDLEEPSYVGDTWIKTDHASVALNAGDYIIIDFISVPNMNSITEMRKVRTVPGSSNKWIELETPLRYAHAAQADLRKWVPGTDNYVEHYIVERTDLESISMHLHMRDSGETATNDFDRRWLGGKVGGMSIIGEEGGLVTVNWDSLIFLDMLHNQPRHAGTTRYAEGINDAEGANVTANMPGYAIMNDIEQADIAFPTTQPYYFSGGTVNLFGVAGTPTEFARIRSFAITINNNADQRFYISQRHGDHRGPAEIREQRREYSMSCTVALPDTEATSGTSIDSATSIFKELLLEGRYDPSNTQGFNISLKFIRGSGTLGLDKDDAIYIDIPGPAPGQTSFETPGTPNSTSSSLGLAGAFLRSAPHTIMTEAPFQVACDFVFRNIAIMVRDREPVYP